MLTKLLFIILIILIMGCATTSKTTLQDTQGFLTNYQGLVETDWSNGSLVYMKTGDDFSFLKQYNKFLLYDIEVWYSDLSEYKGINPDDLKAITDYFEEALYRELSPDYQIITQPDPEAMYIRVAITGLKQEKPDNILDYIANNNPNMVEAKMEAEGFDGKTGERLFAFIDKRDSSQLHIDPQEDSFANTQKVIDYWVGRFRKRLDEAHQL